MTLLPLFVLAHCAHHLLTALPMPLLPFIRNDFTLNYTQAALVTSAFSLSYGFGQLPAGWLADKLGPRILITIGILGVAMAGLLVGVSHTFLMMIFFLILMGLMGGGYHPASAPLISSSVEPEKRGRALGFHVIGGSVSFFLAPIIAAAIAGVWGWRGSFISLAVPTAIFGIVFFILLGRSEDKGDIKQGTKVSPGATSSVSKSLRPIITFFILTIISGGVGFSITGFIPLYLVDYFGISEQAGASMISIIWSAGLWAGPLGGYLSDRIGREPIILATNAAFGIVIYLLTIMPFSLSIGNFFSIKGLGIGSLLFIIGISSFIRMPVSEAFIMDQTSVHRRSTIYGLYYFAMQQSGGIFAPIVGIVVDHYGFKFCFTAGGAIIVVTTVICSFFLTEKADKQAI